MPHTNITLSAARRAALALAALLPAAAVAADLAAQAATLTADAPHGMVLYIKHCASCHGRRAWGNGLQEIPGLAGQREAYLIVQLANFINSNRQGSELHGPVMHDTLQPPDVNRAQALRDLGAWLARAPPNRDPEHGTGEALPAGKRVYANACAGCHGPSGEGSDQPPVPALASQHYSYLLAQLRGFSSGARAHASGLDVRIVGATDQQQALADYASRLTRASATSEP
jgi:cytochrome c553